MIPEEASKSVQPEPSVPAASDRFRPGVFSCPVVFQTVFHLYHRCATNPGQVARTLEMTVLHSFAVSNRRAIFVYKDESGAIFYMRVKPLGSGIDGDGAVELLVHGIHEPDTSVTKQLKRLLQRRILQIAVDMLAAVLTKNPHFNWKPADLEFLKAFEADWRSLEDEKSDIVPKEKTYVFPRHVNDPCLVLFMFRQNLCGSTYFHRLHEVGVESDKNPMPTLDDCMLESGNLSFPMNHADFTIYFNNSPSKLDPTYQGVSTLTDKGEKLSRQTGTGIAIIEVSLLNANGSPITEVDFGATISPQDSELSVPSEQLLLQEVVEFPLDDAEKFVVKVRIVDTALKRQHIHDMIELTLNQALIGWCVERQIEKSKRKALRPLISMGGRKTHSSFSTDEDRMRAVDNICTGLPALISMLEKSHDLPHPAVARIEFPGVIRASSVATTTLELLERGISKPLAADPINSGNSDLCVVRLSRSEMPRVVSLDWDSANRNAVVKAGSDDALEVIRDNHCTCPEYLCFYCWTNFGKEDEEITPPPMMYKEIMVGGGINEKSATIEFLSGFKARKPGVFKRSFAFIFSVKRNRRILWAYNWNPQLVKT